MSKAQKLSPADALARGRKALEQRARAQREADRLAALLLWSLPVCIETTVIIRSKPAPERWPRVWGRPLFMLAPNAVALEASEAFTESAPKYADPIQEGGGETVLDKPITEQTQEVEVVVKPIVEQSNPQVAQNRKLTRNACPNPVELERSRRIKVSLSTRRRQPISVAPTPPTVDAIEPQDQVEPANDPAPTHAEAASVAVAAILKIRERKAAIPPAVAKPAVDLGNHGGWQLPAMTLDQCKFACTPHQVRPEDHRFCGAPIGWLRGKPTSYCDTHLSVVMGAPGRGSGGRSISDLSRGIVDDE